MNPAQTIFAIGNGPSLRGFDFHKLDGFDTLGMNAAYRYWDRICWYPTYYCCLDDQLIQTHHAEIKRLVVENLVRGAFVHGSFFELHPECASDECFWSSDQFHPYWFKRRGAATGLKYIESAAFKTSDTSKITTGSYAVRFCSFLGYQTIGLLGIDLRYTEILPDAERGDGITLRMKKTPEHNPNYFFDDYQRAGDRYNIPNPNVHQGDLHLRAFRVLRDDFFQNHIESRIVNCNPTSALRSDAIFPFEPVEKLTGASQLGAVVVPCTTDEKEQLLTNFQLWSQPAFAPSLHTQQKLQPKLVLVFNHAEKETFAEIEQNFNKLNLDRFFSGIYFRSLDLQGDADAYIRSYARPSGVQGYKAGPNNQFFMTMRSSKDYGRYIFLMETDCIPIRPDWLRHISSVVDGAEPFFVMGSAYRGVGRLSKSFSRHINGNAVYAVGDPDFITFLDEFWEPELRRAIEHDDRRLAYDCIVEAVLGGAHADSPDNESWRTWQRTAHKFRYTEFIQNISTGEDVATAKASMVRDILSGQPGTYMIHSRAVARAACNLLASGRYPEPVELDPSPEAAAQTSSVKPGRLSSEAGQFNIVRALAKTLNKLK